jgi:tetratricopeptide (TPR) repeat protein
VFLLQFLVACGGAEERKQKHLQKAKTFYNNGHYELALDEFRNASYIKPSDFPIHQQLARTYEKIGNISSAIASYRRVVALNPADKAFQIKLGQLYLLNGELGRAKEYADALLQEKPNLAEALLIHSQIMSRRGRISAAFKYSQDALQSDPGIIAAHTQLASLHLYQQQDEFAAQVLRKGLEQFPGDARLLAQLARVHFLQGSSSNAQKFLQSALQSDPENASYRTLLSRISTNSSQAFPEGISQPFSWLSIEDEFFPNQVRMEQLLERTPSAIAPLSLLVRLLIHKGEYAQAEFFIHRALSEEPDNTIARNFLAETLIEQKQFSKAIVHLNQVIRSQPGWWLPYRNKSLALIEEGDIPQAIQTYRLGIKFARTSKVLRLDLALLYEQDSQIKEAVTVYEGMLRENPQALVATNNLSMLLANDKKIPDGLARAQELIKTLAGEENPAYLDTIGWVQLKAGKMDTAIEALQQAVKQAPDIATIRYHLGKAYLEYGDEVKADKHLEKAIRLNESFPEREDALALIAKMKLTKSVPSPSRSAD